MQFAILDNHYCNLQPQSQIIYKAAMKNCRRSHIMHMHVKRNGLGQEFRREGWTETAIIVCKLNKSL